MKHTVSSDLLTCHPRTTICLVGRQDTVKGLDVLLEAYVGLSDLAPLVLMLANFGETPRKFPDGVTVVYNVPHAQVMAGWLHCAVGVVPSIWPEPFGQVVVDAMICGKLVVASAIGGIPDIILSGESGLLVEQETQTPCERHAGVTTRP